LQITPRPVTPQPVKPQQSDTAENEVLRVITQLYSGTQPNDAKMYTGMYFETTMYFGKMMPVYQIIAEKQKYFDRWPNRTYKMKSIEPVKCTGTDPQTECKVSGVVDFEASNQIKRSVGTATFEYTFRSWPDNWQERLGFKISAEGGKVLTRQVADVLKEQQGFEKPWPDAPAKPWQPSTAPAAGAILKVPPRW